VLILIASVATLLIQLAISRSCEYLADETGAYLCGKPLGLANALLKLEQAAHTAPLHRNPQTAHRAADGLTR
jgi:heat shock protein HtpX